MKSFFLSFKNRLKIFLTVFSIVPLLIIGWNSYEAILNERAHQKQMDIESMYLSRAESLEAFFLLSVESDLHSVVNSAAYFNENAQNSMDDYVASLSGLKVKDMDMYFVVSTDGITNYVSGKPNLQLVKNMSVTKNANMSVGIKELDKDLVFFQCV